MDVHGEDIHDRAWRFPLAHVLDASLHEEEGRAGIDGEHPVPELPGAGEERGAIGQSRRV